MGESVIHRNHGESVIHGKNGMCAYVIHSNVIEQMRQ